MELTDRTKPVDNKVKPVLFDQFQKSADWMVPRGRFYYTPMGAFAKGMTGGDIFVCLFINCSEYWSGPGNRTRNRTRDLSLCSQALYRLS